MVGVSVTGQPQAGPADAARGAGEAARHPVSSGGTPSAHRHPRAPSTGSDTREHPAVKAAPHTTDGREAQSPVRALWPPGAVPGSALPLGQASLEGQEGMGVGSP